MKKLLIFFTVLILGVNSFGQLVINQTMTPAQLVQNVLLGGGVTVSNIKMTKGSSVQYGSFSNGATTNLGLNSGVVLTTGKATSIPNKASVLASSTLGNPGDSDLTAIVSPDDTHDACVLEFDFVPLSDTIKFKYIFASEEYPEFVNSFNDVFAFFITGPNPAGGNYTKKNIALIPGTSLPVTINNVNEGQGNCPTLNGCTNCAYYVNNCTGTTIVYNGFTTPLTAIANVVPCTTYHLKLAIADVADDAYDSGVFLQANSFSSTGVSVTAASTNPAFGSNAVEGCANGIFTFTAATTLTTPMVIHYTIGGTAVNGVDYVHIADSITIASGTNSASVVIQPNIINSGTQTVILTTANPCGGNKTDTIFILNQPAPIIPVVSGPDTICPGTSASISVTTSGGMSPYSYIWSNGNTTTSFSASPTSNTTYVVTVSDLCGNEVKDSVTVHPVNTIVATSVAPINPSICKTGNVTLTASGTANSYSWSPSTGLSATTGQTVVASPGVSTLYTVVASSNGCSGSATVTVNVHNTTTASLNHVDDKCNGDANGTATITPITGTQPYTYSWNTIPIQTTATATGLSSGTYSVSISDANSCDTVYSVTISQPSAITALATVNSNVLCNGGSNGSATVTASGGTPGTPQYTYSWDDSETTATATNLSAGSHIVTVTDANGCTKTATVNITQPAVLSASASVNNNVLCNGGNNGSATVNVNGGTTAYTFIWDSGANTQTAVNLNAGNHTVTVTDAYGCKTTTTVDITQPSALSASANMNSAVSCFGGGNGSATVNVNGGTPAGSGYNYIWDSGSTNATATNLIAGSHTVTITDANNCTTTATISISQPSQITVQANSITNVSCYGGSDGVANAVANGGTLPYSSYQWTSGATTPTATNLSEGLNTVTVTDANGCSQTASVTINQPAQLIITKFTPDTILCYGDKTGTIHTTITGGTPAYTYAWSNSTSGPNLLNVPAGNYTLTVTDKNKCTTTASFDLLQPAQIVAQVVKNSTYTIIKCHGDGNGEITIQGTGGTPPLTFNWNTSATGLTINNLSGSPTGTPYTDTITDANGCKKIFTVKVYEPTALNVTSGSTDAHCKNECDGKVTSFVTGGTPFSNGTYTYLWTHNSDTYNVADTNGLCPGAYQLMVTDANGCTELANTYIHINDSITADFVANPSSGFVPLTVSFIYTGTNDSLNNQYSWDFGDQSPIDTTQNPVHTYITQDTFKVCLKLKNKICDDSICKFINTEFKSTLTIPNVFTPNGDGKNDEFKVRDTNIVQFNCMIFDRWGKKIYEWSDISKGWNGKNQGTGGLASDGVYFYIIKATGRDNVVHDSHGYVTLIGGKK